MNYIKLLSAVGFLWLGSALVTQAQILNDSTESVYGSATTMVIREADIFKGNLIPSRIDTSLTNLQSLRHWYYDSTLLQDLGTVGTASQPLFWQMPTVLGNRLGRHAFDPYSVNPATIEYYDTKSPYTFLNYAQGSLGEQIFRAKHTRNVKPNWNVGVGYERVGSDRQIGFIGNQAKGMVSHYGLQAFTHYFSKDERYRIMANFNQTSHDQIELGGIRPEEGDTRDSLYSYLSEAVWLTKAASDEKRTNLHATHWYKLLGAGLQLYHTLDYNTQNNEFSDEDLPYSSEADEEPALLFYPRTLLDTDQTLDNSYFKQLENTFGVMGSGRLFVYRAYAKRRDGSYTVEARGAQASLNPDGNPIWSYYQTKEKRTIADNFIGGEAQFRLKNDIYVTTDAELQIGGGDYRINAQARFKFLTLRQTRASYTPTLLQRVFTSNHFKWFKDFENTQATQTAATLEAGLGKHYVMGQLQFTNLVNHVYYQGKGTGAEQSLAEPAQTPASINLLQASLRYKFMVKSLVLDNTVHYNSTTGPDVIRMPEWYVNSKAYIQRPLFNNAINVQVGVEMNWHSSYYADAYMPVTQQFYLQDDFVISRYPTLDVFLNTDIKTVNIFLKASHLNTTIPGWEEGYFSTPYYLANPFSFIFGVRWNFYD